MLKIRAQKEEKKNNRTKLLSKQGLNHIKTEK
jgi:hypothetical protein